MVYHGQGKSQEKVYLGLWFQGVRGRDVRAKALQQELEAEGSPIVLKAQIRESERGRV